MTAVGKMIRVKSRDGFVFDAYRADPAGAPRGGVVVIQEIFGLSDHVKDMASRFAEAGYVAIAPSMFDRAAPGFIVQPPDVAGALARGRDLAVGNGPENAMNDVGGVIDALAGVGPVFVTGYCYGGTMSWLAAARHPELKAASCYYGGNITGLLGEEPKCQTVLHFGAHDPFIPMDKVNQIRAAKPLVPIHVYDAGHGFARKGSSDYNEAADTLAFKRTLDLFAHAVAR